MELAHVAPVDNHADQSCKRILSQTLMPTIERIVWK